MYPAAPSDLIFVLFWLIFRDKWKGETRVHIIQSPQACIQILSSQVYYSPLIVLFCGKGGSAVWTGLLYNTTIITIAQCVFLLFICGVFSGLSAEWNSGYDFVCDATTETTTRCFQFSRTLAVIGPRCRRLIQCARGAREPNPAQPMLCVVLLLSLDDGGVCEIFVVPQFIIYLGEEWINGCGYRKTMHARSFRWRRRNSKDGQWIRLLIYSGEWHHRCCSIMCGSCLDIMGVTNPNPQWRSPSFNWAAKENIHTQAQVDLSRRMRQSRRPEWIEFV